MNGVSAGLFEHLRGRSSLVDRQPVGFAVLLTGQTHDDGKRTTDLLLDRPNDLTSEASTVLHGTSVLVAALIRVPTQERSEDVVVGTVNLDGVAARRLHPSGSLGEHANQPIKIFLGCLVVRSPLALVDGSHLAQFFWRAIGHRAHVTRRLRRGRDQLRSAVEGIDARHLAVVCHLHTELAACVVDCVGQRLKTGDEPVFRKPRFLAAGAAQRIRNSAATGDDQTRSTSCTRHEVVDVALFDFPVFTQVHVHRRENHAIGHGHRADGAWCEQVRKGLASDRHEQTLELDHAHPLPHSRSTRLHAL